WYAGPVQVTLTAVDTLSGPDQSYYSVDGGAAQPYAGAFSHGQKGVHTITFWSVDKAGNPEDSTAASNTITLKIDDIAPSTGATMVPVNPNGSNGWYTTAV